MNVYSLIVDSGCSAVIFDLDGVVTDTAQLHAHAWKITFDKWMKFYQSHNKGISTIKPFDVVKDYDNYMAGRERLEGVRVFLASRSVELPLGDEDDYPFISISGLGKYKNTIYVDELKNSEIKVYNYAVKFIRRLRKAGLSIALATSSKNSPLIMEKTGLAPLFDVIVDGNHVEALSLCSKPAPDIFIYAASQLGLSLECCAVFEDSHEALASVATAGAACTIGVAKNESELHRFGDMTVITKFD